MLTMRVDGVSGDRTRGKRQMEFVLTALLQPLRSISGSRTKRCTNAEGEEHSRFYSSYTSGCAVTDV